MFRSFALYPQLLQAQRTNSSNFSMFSPRILIGALAVLMLSASLEAFSVCPVSKSSLGCRRAMASASPGVLARTSSVSHVSRARASGWVRSSALRMAEEASTSDDTVTNMEEREFQLEELEDRDVMETSIVLGKDGSITAGATNGPLPLSVRGKWSFDGETFNMNISREFDASIPYTVERVYTGYIEEMLPATDTLILTGDIVMEDMAVGFFKMISAPSDILDSLNHIDEKITQRAA